MQPLIRISCRQNSGARRILASLFLIGMLSHWDALPVEAQGRVRPCQSMIVGDYYARMAAQKAAVQNALKKEIQKSAVVAQNAQLQIGKLSEQLQTAQSEQQRKLRQKESCETELRDARRELSEIKNTLLNADQYPQLQKAKASLESAVQAEGESLNQFLKTDSASFKSRQELASIVSRLPASRKDQLKSDETYQKRHQVTENAFAQLQELQVRLQKEAPDYQEALEQVRNAQDRLDQAESDLKRTSLAVVSSKTQLVRNQQLLKFSRTRMVQLRAQMP